MERAWHFNSFNVVVQRQNRKRKGQQSSSSFTLITTGRIETYQTATYSIRTFLKMDYWSPKHVELLNVMNKINRQILCILLGYIYKSMLIETKCSLRRICHHYDKKSVLTTKCPNIWSNATYSHGYGSYQTHITLIIQKHNAPSLDKRWAKRINRDWTNNYSMEGMANYLGVPQHLQQPKPKDELTDPHRQSACSEVTITTTLTVGVTPW